MIITYGLFHLTIRNLLFITSLYRVSLQFFLFFLKKMGFETTDRFKMFPFIYIEFGEQEDELKSVVVTTY